MPLDTLKTYSLFSPMFRRDTILLLSVCVPLHQSPFWKRIYSKRKEFRVEPFSDQKQKQFLQRFIPSSKSVLLKGLDLHLFGFVCFLFLLMSGKGCGLWFWHSLDLSLTFFWYMIAFPRFFLYNRDLIFWLPVCFSAHKATFAKVSLLKEKNLLPKESILFPFKVDAFSGVGQNYIYRFAAPESLSSPLNILLVRTQQIEKKSKHWQHLWMDCLSV